MKIFGEDKTVGSDVKHVLRALLPFEWNEGAGWFEARTQLSFRPKGLALWGAHLAQASVERIDSGNRIEGVTAVGPVPAQFYALLQGQSYQHLVKMIEDGEPPPFWQEFSSIEPGVSLRVWVTREGRAIGPADGVELAMWGLTVR